MIDALAAFAPSIVTALSALALLSQVFLVALLLTAIVRPEGMLPRWVARHALWLMFIVACVATAGSLYFSEIAGWTPCKECWFQRIFMYPQPVLLAIALWKGDRHVARSILALCFLGILVSVHHYAEQVTAALHPAVSLTPCDASGTSCATTPFFRFGYITIPMLAMTAFALNIAGSWLALRTRPRATLAA